MQPEPRACIMALYSHQTFFLSVAFYSTKNEQPNRRALSDAHEIVQSKNAHQRCLECSSVCFCTTAIVVQTVFATFCAHGYLSTQASSTSTKTGACQPSNTRREDNKRSLGQSQVPWSLDEDTSQATSSG